MNFYPEDGKGYMSQLWHGKKWLDDMPDDMVTPMVIHPETAEHYYVGEICQLKNGSYFIPTRWFRRKDEGLWGKGFAVDHTAVLICLLHLSHIFLTTLSRMVLWLAPEGRLSAK